MKGMGVDIVQVSRFNKSESHNLSMAKRILTQTEFDVYQARSKKNFESGHRYLAKRFAVKEAASKALGVGIAKGVSFQDFHTSNDDLGAPSMHFTGQALAIFVEMGATSIQLSISDEQDYAVAFVILC